jgi:hypothetical protein
LRVGAGAIGAEGEEGTLLKAHSEGGKAAKVEIRAAIVHALASPRAGV